MRKDSSRGSVYLVKREGAAQERWATLEDVGSSKEGLVPALFIEEADLKGAWKNHVSWQDTILIIDNKALTHRPDLWGHRGFAREVAALLEVKLKPDDAIYAHMPVKNYEHAAPVQESMPFGLEIDQSNQSCGRPCNRLAAVYMPEVTYTASLPSIAFRLARIDARPIDMFVDVTNYVMFDIGHPMHAFDAAKIGTKKVEVRCASPGEKIKLLDGEEVALLAQDCVISDGVKPLSVAGVMGGRSQPLVARQAHCS